MLRIIFSIFVTLVVSTARARTVSEQGDYVVVCHKSPMDIGLVLDSSTSINYAEFDKGKEFLQDFLQQYEIGEGPEDSRVSIILFGRGIYTQYAFNLTTYSSKEQVINAIGKIQHELGTYTATGEGIHYMSQVQLSPAVTRPGVDRIGIVITDGNSQDPDITKAEAELAQNSGIQMFAVGVGNVTDQELLNIAGDQDRVFKVQNYEDLMHIKETLAKKTCFKFLKPTTTPLPQTVCGEDSPADIYFAFSPVELGMSGTAWATSFISSTVGHEELEEGFRFGVVSGNCPDDEGFDLDDYTTVEGIRARVDKFKSGKMSKLVQRLTNGGYSEASGGRPDALDIAVLMAPGGKRNKALSRHVESLLAMGVEVYIADPTKSGIQVTGATTLVGAGARAAAMDFVNHLCPQRMSDA